MRILCILIILFCFRFSFAQDPEYRSIHQEESEYYSGHKAEIYSVDPEGPAFANPGCTLDRIVFGYHPYWIGNAYLNYQWNLLSDLCYFSYEVDPLTGGPTTIHNWLTDPAIDSAQANGVRIHLCATLFSGHGTFFSNPVSRQTLIDSLISLVEMRNADGINLDFEAVASAWGDEMVDFTIDLSQQYHAIDPDGIVSMAIPAVDWSEIFDIPALNEYVDLFFIMGYDYYWNGSSQAGPVTPLYSMVGNYNYNLSRTTSYYQMQGIPVEKFILGIPYYGRQWATLSGIAPSAITGYGTAYKYSTIMNGSWGNYSPENRKWEFRSFSTYYAFQENNHWRQCFLCEVPDLNYRYKIIHYRNLAGIGIWALGYDDGYPELWQLIADNFTDCATPICLDTIYDSGGPEGGYYDNEDYTLNIKSCDGTPIILSFETFILEHGFDSLWIHDGADTTAPVVGAYSWNTLPDPIVSSGSDLTLHFISDEVIISYGWEAVWMTGSVSISEKPSPEKNILLYPDPAKTILNVVISEEILEKMNAADGPMEIVTYNSAGIKVEAFRIPKAEKRIEIDVTGYSSGIYVLVLRDGSGSRFIKKFMVTR